MVYSANCEYDTPELSRLGIRLILVTLGADGVFCRFGEHSGYAHTRRSGEYGMNSTFENGFMKGCFLLHSLTLYCSIPYFLKIQTNVFPPGKLFCTLSVINGANYLNVGNCSVILYSFFSHFLCACTKIKNMLTNPLLSVEMRFIIILQRSGNVSSFPKTT